MTIFLLLLAFGCFNSAAAGVTLEPSTQMPTTGESFTVDVFVTPGTPIRGLQFDLQFDSSKLQIESVSEGILLSQNGDSIFFNDGNIDNNAGILSDVYGLILGRSSSILEPESFASITMSVKEQATSTSTISLKNVIMADPSGSTIDVLIKDTTLTINGETADAYNPYDENENYVIDIVELRTAIDGYRNGLISIVEISELIDIYRSGKPYY